MRQSGLVQPAPNKTRELRANDLQELREGEPVDPKIIVDLGPDPNAPQNVVVEPALEQAPTVVDVPRAVQRAPPVDVQHVTPTMPKVEITPRSRAVQPRGTGLVVVVYVLATLALAASIYARWFAG
jgi:hypothetical protein